MFKLIQFLLVATLLCPSSIFASSNLKYSKFLKSLTEKKLLLDDKWHIEILPPGKITSILPTLGGAYIIISIEEDQQIYLYNTITAKIDKKIILQSPENILSSGNNILLVYYPALHLFEQYDLLTLKKIKEKNINAKYNITEIAMGASNSKIALISYSKDSLPVNKNKSQNPFAQRYYALMGLKNFKIHNLTPKLNKFYGVHQRDIIQINANDKLDKIVCWRLNVSNGKYEYIAIDTRKYNAHITHEKEHFGALDISSKGSFIFTSDGYVVAKPKGKNSCRKIKYYKNSKLYKIIGGNNFAQVVAIMKKQNQHMAQRNNKAKVIIRNTRNLSKKYEVECPPEILYKNIRPGRVKKHKNIIISALTNRITFVDFNTNKIITKKIKL